MIGKVLLFGCSHLPTLDAAFKFDMWVRCARMQDADILAVHTISNAHPCSFGLKPSEIYSFDTDVGHGSRDGDMDGWGRAFCKGVEIAIDEGYTWAVHMECDLLSRVNIHDVIRHLEAKGKPFGSPWCSQVNNIETGLMWMRVDRLKEIDFINCYSWPKIRPEMNVFQRIAWQPERVIGRIFGEECEQSSNQGYPPPWDSQHC